jgi:hypothetical protein
LEALGLLEPIDLARVRAILQEYSSGGLANELGATTPSTDAADAGRQAAARVRAGVEHIQGIAKNYKAFWDRNAEQNARSIQR